MERSHRKYNSGRHTAFSISGIPRLGAGSLLVLIFSAFKLISAAPSFAVSKDGVMCGWYRISFCKAKFTLLRDKTKAQAVESSVSHPFQNRERDGAASVGMRAGKSKKERWASSPWTPQPLTARTIRSVISLRVVAFT